MRGFWLIFTGMLFFTGCASAVYQYEYEEQNGIQYPSSISVGYYPNVTPISISKKAHLSVGMDMAYLVVPMGSNIMLYNRNFYAGLRIGDQWSTPDNEVLGAEFQAGVNYFLNEKSVVSLGASYTTLDLTPKNIVEGNLKGLKLTFNKILISDNKAASFLPRVLTVYLSNNMYSYDFNGVVEREFYSDTLSGYDTLNLHYRDYLWSVGLGLYMRFSSLTYTIELGRVFPRYLYDVANSNPIRYEAYLTTGFYMNF